MKKNFIAHHFILFIFSGLLLLLSSHFTTAPFVTTAYAAAVDGTPCPDARACQDNPLLYCSTDTQTCKTKGAVGAACSQSSFGIDCQAELSCIENKCSARGATDTECDPDNNSQDCQADNFCNPDGDKCKPKGKNGATCDPSLSNVDCGPGLLCTENKCVASVQAPLPPCAVADQVPCLSFYTAFGKISTDVSGFVRTVFGILLAASGGIAILLMIRASFKIMTSEGKPEAVKEGRDQLIAAIVGLIFLIFAFVFLELIGVSILQIPGFK